MVPTLFAALLVAAPPAPFHVPEPTLDADEVRIGPPLVRRFAFVNAGPEPLTVTALSASCGCATPTLPQRVYRPGERGELALEVNTLSQPAGPHRWTLRVGYRCGEHDGEATLELTARLRQEIEVRPAALAFQGGGALQARVTVHDPRPRPLTVKSVTASSPYLRASTAADAVVVAVAADCPEGRYAETIILATDDPDYREIKLPVSIVRPSRQRVTASPARVTLAGGSALVQLRDAEGGPVQVESVEAQPPALACRWATGPGHCATVRVNLDRAKWDGSKLAGEVRVKLREPAGAVVIPVSVTASE